MNQISYDKLVNCTFLERDRMIHKLFDFYLYSGYIVNEIKLCTKAWLLLKRFMSNGLDIETNKKMLDLGIHGYLYGSNLIIDDKIDGIKVAIFSRQFNSYFFWKKMET